MADLRSRMVGPFVPVREQESVNMQNLAGIFPDPASVAIADVILAYRDEYGEKSSSLSSLQNILKKMDSDTPDGRISFWEFLYAVDGDDDGLSTRRDAARFLNGAEAPPMYCTETESLRCSQTYHEWETRFGVLRSLVVYLQQDGLLGPCDILLENLNLYRVGIPQPKRFFLDDPEELQDWARTDRLFEHMRVTGTLPQYEDDPDASLTSEDGDDWLEDDDCDGAQDYDDDYMSETCNDDPDYEDRFERYNDEDANEDGFDPGTEAEFLDENDSNGNSEVEVDGEALPEDVEGEDSGFAQGEGDADGIEDIPDGSREELPDLHEFLEDTVEQIHNIEDSGDSYDEETYEDLLEARDRTIENMREMMRFSLKF